jgi:uncharacterized protein (TIGR03089 family)
VTTFPSLLADLLRRDPGRPLVTFYDDATGERVELSVTTYANWVAKTSSLFVEELDLERGDTIRVDLPTHWLGPVFLGAAWNVGLTLSYDDGLADLVVCGPDGLDRWSDHDRVLACSLRPMGVRFAEPLPTGVHDFGVEVWGQPDAFVPWDPPTADDPATPDATQAELLTANGSLLDDGGRLLTTVNPVTPEGLATFVQPLLRRGSTVWVRNADPAGWPRKYDDERATAQLGAPG